MLKIYTKFYKSRELKYILDYFFKFSLGVSYELVTYENSALIIRMDGFSDILINQRDWDDFRLPKSFLNGKSIIYFDENENEKENFDFFYYAFLILSRFEELNNTNLDKLGRFPFGESFLSKFDLIQRPVVDEYVLHLKQLLKNHFKLSDNDFKKSNFLTQVTFDVDAPRNPIYKNLNSFLKGTIKDLLKNRKLGSFYLIGDSNRFSEDSYFNYEWAFSKLNVSKHNPYLFLISGHSHALDDWYELSHKSIRWIIERCQQLGIKVGVHGSLKSYCSKGMLSAEREKLESALSYPVEDIRQHFLMFDISQTHECQELANFKRDWTMGFSESVGYRAGTTKPYYPYSFKLQKALSLIVEPLVAMDATILEDKYMGLKNEEEIIKIYKTHYEICQKHEGHFNILFHNTHLNNPVMRSVYERVLSW